jgi:hypothetical protein
MALIARFDRKPRRIHAQVECGNSYHVVDGETILQLETYGSPDREIPGKVSQSLATFVGPKAVQRWLASAPSRRALSSASARNALVVARSSLRAAAIEPARNSVP